MDELEISGKRYISSRRAGKEHKYHPDYIGQLVRTGKVDGQKVGRAWYVDADSLSLYLSKDPGPRLSGQADGLIEKPLKKLEEIAEEPVDIIEGAEEQIIVEEPEIINAEQNVIEEEIQKEKISVRTVHNYIPIKISKPKTGGLTYVADDAPLFPAIKKNGVPMTTIPLMSREREQIIKREPDHIIPVVKPKKRAPIFRLGLVLIAVGCVTFVIATLVSSNVIQTTIIGGDQTASVQYSLK